MDFQTPLPAFKLNNEKTIAHDSMELIGSRPETMNLETWQNAKLPVLARDSAGGTGSRALEHKNLLRKYAVWPLNCTKRGFKGRFLPWKLLEHVLNEKAVRDIVAELIHHGSLSMDTGNRKLSENEAESYWTNMICATEKHSGYRRVLAILLLTGKEGFISTFIAQDVNDGTLPVGEEQVEFPREDEGWMDEDTDKFFDYQTSVDPPLFAPDPTGPDTPPHFKLEVNEVKLWVRTSVSSSQLQGSSLGGAFGEVYQVIIHPWQHDFHEVLTSVRMNRFNHTHTEQ